NAINLNHQPFESWVIRNFPAQVPDRFWVLKEGDRKIDRDLDRAALGDEIVQIMDRLINDELRQGAELRATILRYEIPRRDNPPGRMTQADQRLGTARLTAT